MKVRYSRSDRIFYTTINIILSILSLLILYPLTYIVSASFSDAAAVTSGKVILWPVNPCLDGYLAVLGNKNIGIGYYNTLIYTIGGTLLNVSATMVAAYPLSRRDMPFRGIFTFLFTFTMLFGGGMIPNYLLIRDLGLLNNRLAVIIPGMISVYNMVLARTFMQNLPHDMIEAAQIDGCSDTRYFFTMILPLSSACIAVLSLYYAVSHWNAYFNAFLYLNDRDKYPLSLFLREILIANQMLGEMNVDEEILQRRQELSDVLKYSLIVVSTLPVMCIYPFCQKFFVKGVMIGSLKG